MRLGAWLVLFGLASPVGACSGGYPLPPTRCDEWCDATNGMMCEDFYQPASCVSQCEQGQFGAPECSVQLDAVLACFRASPRAKKQLCGFPTVEGLPNDCQAQSGALGECVGFLLSNNFQR